MRKIIMTLFVILAFICACSEQEKKPVSNNLDKATDMEKGVAKEKKNTNPMKDIEYLTKMIKEQPQSALAYNNRGTAYHSLKQHELAIEDYNKAINLKKDYADAYNNRGASYYSLGKHQQAIEDFNKAISLKQNFASAYANRGLTYLNQGNKELGCPDAKKACELGICKVSKEAQSKKVCP